MSGDDNVFNPEEIEREEKERRDERDSYIKELLSTLPTPHADAENVQDLMSDLTVDAYVRAILHCQDDVSHVLSKLTFENYFVDEVYPGGSIDLHDEVERDYVPFITEILDEYIKGQKHIRNKLKDGWEYAAEISGGDTSRVGYNHYVSASGSGWVDYMNDNEWNPPEEVDYYLSEADAIENSTQLIEEMFKDSILYQEIKSRLLNDEDVFVKSSSITKNTLQVLYDVIGALRITLGITTVNSSYSFLRGISGTGPVVTRLWSADKAIELQILNNPGAGGSIELTIQRLKTMPDIDRVIREFKNSQALTAAEIEATDFARLQGVSAGLEGVEAQYKSLEISMDNIRQTVLDNFDEKVSGLNEFLNAEKATHELQLYQIELKNVEALGNSLVNAGAGADAFAEINLQKREIIEQIEIAQSRADLATKFTDLSVKKARALVDIGEARNDLFATKKLIADRDVEAVIFKKREQELITKLYEGGSGEDVIGIEQEFSNLYENIGNNVDRAFLNRNLARQANDEFLQSLPPPEFDIKTGETTYRELDSIELTEMKSHSDAVDAAQLEYKTVMDEYKEQNIVNIKKDVGSNFRSTIDSAMEEARTNARTQIELRQASERLDSWKFQAEDVEGIIEVFSADSVLLDVTVLDRLLAMITVESVLGFGSSLMLNILNVVFIYLSVEDLIRNVENTLDIKSAQLAMLNPNVQRMLTYYSQTQGSEYAKEIVEQALKSQPFIDKIKQFSKQEEMANDPNNPANLVQEIRDAFNSMSETDPRKSHCHGQSSTIEAMFWKATDIERNHIHAFYVKDHSKYMAFEDLQPYYELTTTFHDFQLVDTLNEFITLIAKILDNVNHPIVSTVPSAYPWGMPLGEYQSQELVRSILKSYQSGHNSAGLSYYDNPDIELLMENPDYTCGDDVCPAVNILDDISIFREAASDLSDIQQMRLSSKEIWTKDGLHMFVKYDSQNTKVIAFSLITGGEIAKFTVTGKILEGWVSNYAYVKVYVNASFTVINMSGGYFLFESTYVEPPTPTPTPTPTPIPISAGGGAGIGILAVAAIAGGYFLSQGPSKKRKRNK